MNIGFIGFRIVEQEVAEEAVRRHRLERQIREVRRQTAARRGGGLIEQRPGPGRPRFVRKVDFETAMRQLEKNGHPTTAARMRLAREA
jgi:hypothetical protein